MLRTSLSHIFSDCFQASKLMTPGQPQLHLAQNFTGSLIIGGASHNFDILKMVKKSHGFSTEEEGSSLQVERNHWKSWSFHVSIQHILDPKLIADNQII